jgi:type I restriction enzyme R subunit
MPGIHTEEAFESHVEARLLERGYLKGSNDDYVPELALDPAQLFAFIRATQPDEWAKYEAIAGHDPQGAFLKRLTQELAARGSLDVWRRGIKDKNTFFRLAYFKPATKAGPDLLARYAANRLSVTRQLRYDANHAKTLDLAIFLNGIPLLTAELKNHASGQSVHDAIKQYRFDRNPVDQIFRYTERALVHFAVDDAEAYMTTRLQGKDTTFLPFNKGRDGGAGNPENPDGYKTEYVWEEVWAPDSLLDIVARFIDIEYAGGGKKVAKKGRVIFPRYHQLDVVRKLEADAKAAGPGRNYLIMHSTGSGKSLSIAWSAHRLFTLHDEADERIFHSVVVVTDRVVLNRQLQDTIYSIDHKHGVVERIEHGSTQLAEALEKGAPIIITTLQTFPFVVEKIGNLPDRNYAVIVDEAHSSQTGISAAKLKAVLGGALEELRDVEEAMESGDVDLEDALVALAKSRGKQSNLSFFAFTATPKAKTLEMFGTPGPDGKYRPFHLYSMKQAIEEGFILDVLANYTTYRRFFKLAKRIQEDPEMEKRAAAKAITRFVELHPHNLSQKAAVILDHFHKATRPKINGRAKAMVVTGSRIHAVRMYFALRNELEARDDITDPGILVAFSGTVTDPDTGVSYTEAELNGFGETELPKRFDTDEYRILVVAEKYQTGFDQPLLHTMYVDKKLAGVHAVQTLSRLNRRAPGKEDTFVLDFVNEAEDILEAFKPYYEVAVLESATDPNLLHDLVGALDSFDVYREEELDEFAGVLLRPPHAAEPDDPAKLNAIVDRAVERFRDLDEEGQHTFRRTLNQFVRLYAFLSNVIEWQDPDLEKRFQYGRWLLRKLPAEAGTPNLELDDEVALQAYRLEKTFEGKIDLDAGEPVELEPISALGSRLTDEQYVRLSELLEAINQKFGLNLRPEDMLFFEQVGQDMMSNDQLAEVAKANPQGVFKGEFENAFLDAVLARRDRNEEMLKMVLDSPEFAALIKEMMLPWVYAGLKERKTIPQLIEEGESATVEFKSSARWNYKAGQPTKEIEDAIVKTIAAFLNSKGGTLLIGVDDDGNVVGIEQDLEALKGGDLDAFENWLMGSLLQGAVGKAATSLVNVSFATIDGKTVARLDVQPSPKPVFAKMSKADDVFWARLGNTTQQLKGQDLLDYIDQQWKHTE